MICCSLRRAGSTTDFLASPDGSYFIGGRYCVYARDPTLRGFASWGRPDVADVRELLRLCEFGLAPGLPPYRWLVDLRGLEFIEPATFGLFLEYTSKNRDVLGRNILRGAQLRPDGFVAAILFGFQQLARLSYPDRVFNDVDEAMAWLEIEHQEGVLLLDELDAIRNASCASHDIVQRLRQQLETSGCLAGPEVARRLALSTRSLQRALREAGTTYRLELKAFRLRRAQELLRQGDRNLSWIAEEVGFSSVQHFATAYRRAIGDTPSAWRMRNRMPEDD
jgi:AraC-like DNA-binding protein